MSSSCLVFLTNSPKSDIFAWKKSSAYFQESLCAWAMCITNDMIEGIQAMYSCQVSNVYSIKYS